MENDVELKRIASESLSEMISENREKIALKDYTVINTSVIEARTHTRAVWLKIYNELLKLLRR